MGQLLREAVSQIQSVGEGEKVMAEPVEREMVDYALEFLKRGLTTIPLRGRYAHTLEEAKRPLVKAWKEWIDYKPGKDTVLDWWNEKPLADLGLLTGPAYGLLVLDVDGEKGYQSIADKPIPGTWTVKTRRGTHYYFRWPEELMDSATTKVGVLPGVDTRGKGGYVVAPPSVGVGDFTYTWAEGGSPDEVGLAAAPGWLVDLLKAPKAQSTVNRLNEERLPSEVAQVFEHGRKQGENRVKGLVKLCGYFMPRLKSYEVVDELLSKWNNEKNSPPIDQKTFYRNFNDCWERLKSGKWKGLPEEARPEDTAEKPLVPVRLKQYIGTAPTPIRWTVEEVLPVQSGGFIAGVEGVGKSWLCLDMALAVATGTKWLGKYQCEKGPVLYIDDESSQDLLQQRYWALLRGRGLTEHDVDVTILSNQDVRLDSGAELARLEKVLEALQPRVVFVDSFSTVHSVSVTNNDELKIITRNTTRLMRKYDTSIVFIHHERKHNAEESQGARDMLGGIELPRWADVAFALKQQEGSLYLHQTKARKDITLRPFKINLEKVDDVTSRVYYLHPIDPS